MYPTAKIVVAAPGRETVGTLQRYLGEKFGNTNVGQCGGGRRNTKRITVTTFDSILKVDQLDKIDILLVDEGHRTPATKYERNLMALASPVKRFMFTATQEGRADGAELVMESLFGPELVNVPFSDSVASGSILAIHLIAKDQPHGPSDETLKRLRPGAARDRVAIWRNQQRNQMIANDVREVMAQFDDPQTLILVDKTEHALVLSALLPDFEVVSGDVSSEQRERLEKRGVLAEEDKLMTPTEREEARKRFEKGELRRVIATQVFSTGVSANECQIVAIASGSGSIIQFIQSAGRGTRKCDDINKTHGTVLMWRDVFADAYARRSARLLAAANSVGFHITRVLCPL
jgi:superfamily II DNA or RNA helicase